MKIDRLFLEVRGNAQGGDSLVSKRKTLRGGKKRCRYSEARRTCHIKLWFVTRKCEGKRSKPADGAAEAGREGKK